MSRKKLHRFRGLPAGVTMMETLVVLFLIAIVVSLILPSLASTRFNTRMLMCQNNMREVGRGFMDFAQANKQKLPGNTSTIRPQDDPQRASWLYCSVGVSPAYRTAPESGTLFEFTRHKKLYRCPSLDVAPIGSGQGSNGMFDYGMLNAMYGARIDRLPVTAFFTLEENVGRGSSYPKMCEPLPGTGAPWQNLLPILVEEDPAASVNGCCIEADFSNNDFMANTHRRVGIGQPGVAANYIAADCSVQTISWTSRVRARRIWALNQKFGTANYLGYVGPVQANQWDDGRRVSLMARSGEVNNSNYGDTSAASPLRTDEGIRVPKRLLPKGYEQHGLGPFP